MKIQRATSEKRSWKTVGGDFVSREHFASRELTVPEGLSPEQTKEFSVTLLREVRREVLMPFVIEGVISMEEFTAQMAMYDGLVAEAQAGAQP